MCARGSNRAPACGPSTHPLGALRARLACCRHHGSCRHVGRRFRCRYTPCATPSRLEGQLDATTPDVTVNLKPDTMNAEAVAIALGNKYGVMVRWGYYAMQGFIPQSRSTSRLTRDKIAQLRCELGVDVVVVEQREPRISP